MKTRHEKGESIPTQYMPHVCYVWNLIGMTYPMWYELIRIPPRGKLSRAAQRWELQNPEEFGDMQCSTKYAR